MKSFIGAKKKQSATSKNAELSNSSTASTHGFRCHATQTTSKAGWETKAAGNVPYTTRPNAETQTRRKNKMLKKVGLFLLCSLALAFPFSVEKQETSQLAPYSPGHHLVLVSDNLSGQQVTGVRFDAAICRADFAPANETSAYWIQCALVNPGVDDFLEIGLVAWSRSGVYTGPSVFVTWHVNGSVYTETVAEAKYDTLTRLEFINIGNVWSFTVNREPVKAVVINGFYGSHVNSGYECSSGYAVNFNGSAHVENVEYQNGVWRSVEWDSDQVIPTVWGVTPSYEFGGNKWNPLLEE